jgi:ribosomal protein S18 acetylase RimI-like enzyme
VTTSARSCDIRPFVEPDHARLATLVDDETDPLYAAQSHGLHGVAADGANWSRTLVAETDGRLAGAVTAARNLVHPGRYIVAVEVVTEYRRSGIARSLLHEIGKLRPEPLPFAAKLRPSDLAAMALLRSLGGRIYQHCPGLRPDPSNADIARWCRDHAPPDGVDLVELADLPEAQRAELWVQQYLWVHEEWSPAAAEPLRELAPEIAAEADPHSSVVTISEGVPDSMTWAFPEADGSVTIVSETTRRDTPDGTAKVAAGLARCLQHLVTTSTAAVEIDGHRSDPHLSEVVETLPAVPANPLLLVEFTQPEGQT